MPNNESTPPPGLPWSKPEITHKSTVIDAEFGGNPNFIDHFYPATNGNNLGS